MRHPLLMASFDDLVGEAEDRWRDCKAERVCSLEIDHQLEFRRLFDWQIGRLGTFQDLSDVTADLLIRSRETWSIADQAAGCRELRPLIDRRDRGICRQC